MNTGFTDIDQLVDGFNSGDLIIIGGRPSMGKTAFALNIAWQAATNADAKVLLFSLDMSTIQIGQRFLAIELEIELEKTKIEKLDRQQNFYVMQDGLSRLSTTDIYVDDTSDLKIMEIKNKCSRLKAEKGLDIIIVDYLQLMNIDGQEKHRKKEITALSRAFKQLAIEMDCPIVLLSQLFRSPERRSGDAKRPLLSDLWGSRTLEMSADLVLLLYRDEYYNPYTPKENLAEVIIAKNKYGSTGTVELTFIGNMNKFAEIQK